MIELPLKSPAIWQRFLKENKPLVYRYVLRQIKKAIKENADQAVLYKFAGSKLPTIIKRDQYIKVLEEALNVFIATENYEYALETKKVLDAYYIDTLLNEVNGV